MRAIWFPLAVLVLGACPPKPPDTGDTDADADTDADTDSDTDADADADTDTDTDADTDADCGVPDGSFTGELSASQISDTSPYTTDAGLAAIVAATPDEDVDATVDLQVTNAVVTAVGYVPTNSTDAWTVWLADQNAAVRTYLRDSPEKIPSTVQPGDVVSFHVTGLHNYAGELEITIIDGFTSSGTSDVWVQDVTATDLTLDHASELVHGYGQLVSEPGSCGGSALCSDMLLSSGQTVTFRIRDVFEPRTGDCIEFYMPVGVFANDVQLNVDDFDWVTLY